MTSPEKASDVLGRILDASALGHNIEHVEVYETWREVVGGEIARHTRVTGVSGNVLRVEVDSSPWLCELSSFHKRQLLAELCRRLRKTRITDIHFRIGSF